MPSQGAGNPSSRLLKEQLRLFAFDNSQRPATEATPTFCQGSTKRERLAALLEGELDFHGEDSTYASHDLHAFAAKFPPQLPRAFIRGLTVPGDVVLDPMMGSGTTILEAFLQGRKGIGFDLDPLALRLSRVKTMPLAVDRLREAGQQVLSAARTSVSEDGEDIERYIVGLFDGQTRDFVDYWFLPTSQRELMALVLAIRKISDLLTCRFLELTFSSVVVTKSGGVSRARDLAHSRPHRVEDKVPRNALEQFAVRLRKNLASIAQLDVNGKGAVALPGDARALPVRDGTVDLVVTSPPYANAIDYMRAHKFSLIWLGHPIAELSQWRAKYIGSERVGDIFDCRIELPLRPRGIIRHLAERDPKKAGILRKYYVEMRAVLAEVYRVLRADSAAVVVVGSSIMRGIDVETHYCLADIAGGLGFDVVGVVRRALDRNKRMMPARFGGKTDSMIEQRLHEEYVVGLYKPS